MTKSTKVPAGGVLVKATQDGYADKELHPAGQQFVWTQAHGEELPTWVVPVKAADKNDVPDAPGQARPQTAAEAAVPANAVIETDKDDPARVNLADVGAQGGPQLSERGVSVEEAEASAAKAKAQADAAEKEADKAADKRR